MISMKLMKKRFDISNTAHGRANGYINYIIRKFLRLTRFSITLFLLPAFVSLLPQSWQQSMILNSLKLDTAEAAIRFEQEVARNSVNNGFFSSTLVLTVTANTTAGNSIIITAASSLNPVSSASCSDSRGNTYTRDATVPSSGSNTRLTICAAHNTTALTPSDTITINFGFTVQTRVAVANEFSGIATVSALDRISLNSGIFSSAPFTGSTGITSQANELVIGAVAVAGPNSDSFNTDPTYTVLGRVGTNSSSFGSNQTINSAYKIVSSIGSQSLSSSIMSPSRSWAAGVVTYRAAAVTVNTAPMGGFTNSNIIPAAQITQATDGSGVLTITWKAVDAEMDNVTLNTFEYSVDGGSVWNIPSNGDASASLIASGAPWSSATTFAAAAAHSFTFNTQHADVTGLAGIDQSDVQIRFTVNDGTLDSVVPVASVNVQIDNALPTATYASASYDSASNTLSITGTNFDTMAPVGTDIKNIVNGNNFIWDINGDNAITPDVGFALADVMSLTVSSATTLTLVLTEAKGISLEGTTDFGSMGGADTFDVSNGLSVDLFGNIATADGVANAPITINAANMAPVGGFIADNVIPSAQVVQASDGSGLLTITWKAVDAEADNVTLNSFEYSVDGGNVWNTPTNADASLALSANWADNGSAWTSATTFAAATAHSFTFDTQHADVTGLTGIDQSDVQIRFTVNDGTIDSVAPATSMNVRVDNAIPTATYSSASYDSATNTLILTGSNFTSIANTGSDVKGLVDWTKFLWDINGDNGMTANVSLALVDVTSLTVSNATTLRLVLTGAAATALEGTADFGSVGGVDTLDISTGFSGDGVGNVATADAVANVPMIINTVNTAPVGGFAANNVIPSAQVVQASDGSGLLTITWKAVDAEADNVTLNSFEYSVDGGNVWNTPTNADASLALSANWADNGSAWTSATTFAAATAHSFTFDTQHADVTGLTGIDQSDVQIRFTVNDGTFDSVAPATSVNVPVDNAIPTTTITSASYNATSNTLSIAGTNFDTIATVGTDIKGLVNWNQFIWDINGDNTTTPDITFVLGDISSATITSATTLTIILSNAKAAGIEATPGYGQAADDDTLDISAGFSVDNFGNVATTDAVANVLLNTNTNVSGTIYSDTGNTFIANGSLIRLLINGQDAGTDTTLSGMYNIPTNGLVPGDTLLVYIDGATNDGTSVTVSDGAEITDLDVFANHLILRHDNAGSLSNSLLSTAIGGELDSEILYRVDANNVLTISGGNTVLSVPSGHRMTPGGDVIAHHVNIAGTFDAGDIIFSVSGNWDNTGMFTAGTSTVVFEGAQNTIGGITTFYELVKSVDAVNINSKASRRSAVPSTQGRSVRRNVSGASIDNNVLLFQPGSITSVAYNLMLVGADDSKLTLGSVATGDAWYLSVLNSATYRADYLSIQDSNASGGRFVTATNSIDALRNVNWKILGAGQAVSSAVAEINPTALSVNSTANRMRYSLLPTIEDNNGGVDQIRIIFPADYRNISVIDVTVENIPLEVQCVDHTPGEYCATITDNTVNINLGGALLSSTPIHVTLDIDAPATASVDTILSTVTNTGTVAAPFTAVAGDADGVVNNDNSNQLEIVGPADADLSALVAEPQVLASDGVAVSTLTTTLHNSSNLPVRGKTVTLSSNRGVIDTIVQPSASTDANGITRGSITSETYGTAIITANDTTDGVIISQQAEVYFNQGQVLELVKTVNRKEAQVGDVLTYQIEIKNTVDYAVVDVKLDDSLPPNFRYVQGSARLNGEAMSEPTGNRIKRFVIGTVAPLLDRNNNGQADAGESGYDTLSYQVIVGAGATPRSYLNQVIAVDLCNTCYISNRAEATIDVALDPLFDLGTVIGKVFEDHDRDGYQGSHEPGIAGAMVALDNGSYALTDLYGRYHFPAIKPGQRLIKINLDSVGPGSFATTDAAKVVSVTPGLMAKVNFGVIQLTENETIGRAGERDFKSSSQETEKSTMGVEPIPNLSVKFPPPDVVINTYQVPVSGVTSPGNLIRVNNKDVPVQQDGQFAIMLDVQAGTSEIVVQVQDPKGYRGEVKRKINVSDTQLFFMAFVDGEIGLLRRNGYLEGAGMSDAQQAYSKGRVSYYLKGMIKGKYLITSAFDTRTQTFGNLFKDLDDSESDLLLTNLDPERAYPIYGDDAQLINDAAGQGKFFLALDSEEIRLLMGNYPVNLGDGQLASYRRTLYGGHLQYDSASKTQYNESYTKAEVFAAETRLAHQQDEILSTGGSLYYLSQRNITPNSEQITLNVRDKNTGNLLKEISLQQGIDYRIYYEHGRIFFHRAVHLYGREDELVDVNATLGNPVTIVVDYEYESNNIDQIAAGGRVRQQLGDHIALGATAVQDQLSGERYRLQAVDGELRFLTGTRFSAEVSQSEGAGRVKNLSTDGGLSYKLQVAPATIGKAWKFSATSDLGEWVDVPNRLIADAFITRVDAGFSSSSENKGGQRDNYRARLRYMLTRNNLLQAKHERFELQTPSITSNTMQSITQTSSLLWKHQRQSWRLSGELQTRETTLNGVRREQLLSALRLENNLTQNFSTLIEAQQTLRGKENSHLRFGTKYKLFKYLTLKGSTTLTEDDRSTEAGASYQINKNRFYISERVTEESTGQQNTTTIGEEAAIGDNTRVYSELQRERGDKGKREVSLVGVEQRWLPSKRWTFRLFGNYSTASSVYADLQGATLGGTINYSDAIRWDISTRNEIRRQWGSQRLIQWLTSNNVNLKLSPSYSLLGKWLYSQSKDLDTQTVTALFKEESIGLAIRPIHFDRFNALARYTVLSDKNPQNVSITAFGSEATVKHIAASDFSLDLSKRIEWVEKLAFKRTRYEDPIRATINTNTMLSIHRLNIKIWKKLELGGEYRILYQRETRTRRDGWLAEIGLRATTNLRVGLGYNFTDFSDNIASENNYSVQGVFFRVQGVL